MTKISVDKQNEAGRKILSDEQLGRENRRWKWTSVGLGVLLAISTVANSINAAREHKPLLLDTHTGKIITSYEHVLAQYTIEDRALLARLAYEGLRRRTGVPAVDAEQLAAWGNHITKGALSAWSKSGERWKNPEVVEYGFRRTVRVLSTRADNSSPYTFTIEALETDSTEGMTLKEETYRVRLTLIFSDPTVNGQTTIEGFILHSEEEV